MSLSFSETLNLMSMPGYEFVLENTASRTELSRLIARLDERSFAHPIGAHWTVASTLCHLAFWDQRALFCLRAWKAAGNVEMTPLDSRSVDSINHGVNAISLPIPGLVAAQLALDSASEVDACVATLGQELVERIGSAGFERFLWRSLHRREHLQKISAVVERS